ncbi:MAG TPA: serine/threonine-protein kinase, partial [Vicinamibacteria bacterium]
MTLAPGTRLGAYEIVAQLGAGGMGEVYRARDARLGRDVAVKVLPAHLLDHAEALARFEREARAVAQLSHPNILAIHDVGRQDQVAYAVMELLEGESLRDRLRRGALPVRKAVEYAVQIAEGLSAAHDKGIVHRDLKPENVFVTADGRVKILDFGLARQTTVSPAGAETESPTLSHHTDPGTILGTAAYMSPEQAKGLAADHRSDIFSFGAVLYEMLSGRRAFVRETTAETMAAILKDEPPDLLAVDPAIPPGLARIVHHCLEKSPTARFQSARDLAFDLGSGSESQTTSGRRAGLPAADRSRRWGLAAALALAALTGLAG